MEGAAADAATAAAANAAAALAAAAAAAGVKRPRPEDEAAQGAEGHAGTAATEDPSKRRAKVPLGRWDPDTKLVRVVQNKGKHVNRMGFHEQGSRWLYPEEAGFLVSDGEMDLEETPDGPVLESATAFARVFEALEAHGVEMVDYYTYVALKKLRFHVFRAGTWALPGADMLAGKRAPAAPENGARGHVLLRFDCFSPQAQFSINTRGTPSFQVATSRPTDSVPPVRDMRAMARACEEQGTKLRMAIFDGQSVSFVQVEDFDLQDISAATAVRPVAPAAASAGTVAAADTG